METPITTDRLALHPLRIADAAEMVDVLAAASLYEFTGGEAPNLEALLERYRLQTAGSGRPEEQWRNWIIRIVADGRAVGFVQADVIDNTAELAWVVGVEHQERGVASEAAIAMRNQLAAEGALRFEAYIHPAHAASQAVARRVGMARTGQVDEDGEEHWSTVDQS